MGGSSQHGVENHSSSQLSNNVCDDGTSARTRPFTFDEVMLRRKNKKESAEKSIAPDGADDVSMHCNTEEASDRVKLNRNRGHDPITEETRHGSGDSERESSQKKEIASSKEDKLARNPTKGSRKPETNTDSVQKKNIGIDGTVERKNDRHVRGDKKVDRKSEEKKKELVKRHSEALSRRDRSGGKSRDKYEEERKSSHQAPHNDRQSRGKRKKDDVNSGSENRSKKRDSKDLTGLDRYADRSRGKYEKETKRKHQIEDEERVRDRYESRKHDLGKRQNSDFPQRKENEALKVHHEESKRKRRSRSRERDQDRVRRSSSPKAQKHSSYDTQEHKDSATNSSKNRSGGLHSDTDRRRMSTNGSSGHYRHARSSSGLGGYSPRKRKSEAAARTPSPVRRSPEKRAAGWDLPPSGKESNGPAGLVSSYPQSSNNLPLSTQESASVIPVISATPKPVDISYNFALSKINAVDSIHLTQATRPMRRLYVENLPASATEKTVMEWINDSLLSSGVNYIQGTQPCISCMIHKEKGQALLEFLTLEDASAALSFDGRSFSGSILKIRRPKDFINVTTGVADKSLASSDAINDVVEDSPHKIFIGGISKLISSEMLMEIARVFGPLKAYHFEVNEDIMEPCAFLEYVDHSVTLKACAGLNGMKLGGQVVSVVQAIPDDSQEVGVERKPFYGIPEHAKPLLEKSTQVLKLKNVLDPEGLSSLSEAEVDEILEDIRLECSRFGTVKSINVVKQSNCSSTLDAVHAMDNSGSIDQHESDNDGSGNLREAEHDENELNFAEDPKELDKTSDGYASNDRPSIPGNSVNSAEHGVNKAVACDGDAVGYLKDDVCEQDEDDGNNEEKEPTVRDISGAGSGGLTNQHSEASEDIARSTTLEDHKTRRLTPIEEDLAPDEKGGEQNAACHLNNNDEKDGNTSEKADVEIPNLGKILEPGCILVEFKREEAACRAAHSLHRRVFDNRIVSVGYVDPDAYLKRYPK